MSPPPRNTRPRPHPDAACRAITPPPWFDLRGGFAVPNETTGVTLTDEQRLAWLRLIRSENVGPAGIMAQTPPSFEDDHIDEVGEKTEIVIVRNAGQLARLHGDVLGRRFSLFRRGHLGHRCTAFAVCSPAFYS
jgi:DprA-like N-terminal HHH domain